ncbi:choice-of-anchor D domain-containing protein, partial [bacterium]
GVTFDATDMNGGDYRANILISNNDPLEPELVVPAYLHITGVPDIVADQDTIRFGSLFIGGTRTAILDVMNDGSDWLEVSNVTCSHSSYSVDPTSFNINIDQTQHVEIVFAPTSSGIMSGTITIASDDPDEPTVQVEVTGEGLLSPDIAVTPDSLGSDLYTDETETQLVVIDNAVGQSELNYSIRIVSAEGAHVLDFDHYQAYMSGGMNNTGEYVQNKVVGIYPRAVGDFSFKASSPTALTCVTVDPNTDYIYAQQNSGTGYYRYNPFTDQWTALTNCPLNSGNNGGAVYLNGKIYTCYCWNYDLLGVYNISTDTWSSMQNGLGQGTGNITTDGQYIYLITDKNFRRFDPNTSTWTILAPSPIYYQDWGGLIYHEGVIYGQQGNGSSGFAKYNVSSDSWELLASLPGGAVLGIALDPTAETIFAYGSYSGTNWYAYDIKNAIWSVSTLPLFMVSDGGMAYVGHSDVCGIYLVQGENGSGFGHFETEPKLQWIHVNPNSGSIPSSASENVDANFDAAELEAGNYQAQLYIASNDPDEPELFIPATLIVHEPREPVTDLYGNDFSGGTNRIGDQIQDEDPYTLGVQWMDRDAVIGDPSVNYFYVVTPLDNGEGGASNRFGEFDYNMVTTPTTDFNEIALPLILPGVSNADELMNAIPTCNSIARWNASAQGYEQYVPGLPFTNFDVSPGFPYYVNMTQDTTFTLLGEPASPVFDLITTPTTDFNEVMLTLDCIDVLQASDLMGDIPNCNSVARWNASAQGYEQYVPGLPFTDFEVFVGYPYYVNVTDDTVWPTGGPAKRSFKASEFAEHPMDSHAPHLIWGQFESDSDTLDDQQYEFVAYLASQPYEQLTQQSPGCGIRNGHWMVQCAAFKSSWSDQDMLHVTFCDRSKHTEFEIQVPVTYEASDQSDAIDIKVFEAPSEYYLGQNYPNPFNPSTRIKYQMKNKGRVTVAVYNMKGQKVCELVNHEQTPGYYEIDWQGIDKIGNRVSTGIYFIRMQCHEFTQTRKILMMK